jgi:hypothetical protein
VHLTSYWYIPQRSIPITCRLSTGATTFASICKSHNASYLSAEFLSYETLVCSGAIKDRHLI